MQVKIINGTSKAGQAYQALQINIGEYEARLFPSKAEIAYLKSLLKEKAHEDFEEQ